MESYPEAFGESHSQVSCGNSFQGKNEFLYCMDDFWIYWNLILFMEQVLDSLLVK